jgi:hypothetical protein
VTSLARVAASGQHFPIGLLPDGSLVARLGWSSAQDPPDLATGRRRLQDLVMRYGVDGSVDTVGVFPGSEQHTIVTENARSFGTPPFAWGRSDALRGDELLHAYTERFEVQVLDAGGQLRQVFRGALAPEPVTQAQMDEYLQAARDRLQESPPPNPTSLRLSELRLELTTFPPTHPVLAGMLVDRAGHVWLRHARRADVTGPSDWSVLDPEGRWLGTLQLPETFRPLDVGADYVLGVNTDELGVEYAEVYALGKS